METPDPTIELAERLLIVFRKGVELLRRAIDGIEREWNKLLDAINGLLRRAHRQIEESIWSSLIEWFTETLKDTIEKIQKILQEIDEKVHQVFAVAQEAVGKSVPVESLFRMGFRWGAEVGGPLSNIGGEMTGTGNIEYWRGPTKNAYEKEVKTQTDAVIATVGKVKETSNWLATVAASNTAYMVELGDRAAELAGQIAAVALDLAETAGGAITQAVVTLGHFSDFAGTAVTQITQYGLHLASRLAETVERINQLVNEIQDHNGLSGRHWPQSVKG